MSDFIRALRIGDCVAINDKPRDGRLFRLSKVESRTHNRIVVGGREFDLEGVSTADPALWGRYVLMALTPEDAVEMQHQESVARVYDLACQLSPWWLRQLNQRELDDVEHALRMALRPRPEVDSGSADMEDMSAGSVADRGFGESDAEAPVRR